MTIKSAISTIQTDLKHFGIRRTIYDVLVRILSQILVFKILKVISLSENNKADTLPDAYEFREVDHNEFQSLAMNPEYEIPPVLVRELSQEGNACFGIFDRGALANYVLMYSTNAQITTDLEVCFDSRYAYLCNTFTPHPYRGRHLNSIGVGLAARRFFDRGFQGILAYVDSHNFSSLKSLYRMGWKDIGTVYVLRVFGRYLIRTGSGCLPYGFTVMQLAASRPAQFTTATQLNNQSDAGQDRPEKKKGASVG